MKSVAVVLAFAIVVGRPDRANAQLLTRASVSSTGAEGNDDSSGGRLSSDGRFVTFERPASQLVASDGNQRIYIFVHDLAPGVTTRASVSTSGGDANDESYWPAISGDGRFVAFESWASNLVAGDTRNEDVFVRDLTSDVTVMA